MKNQTLWFCVFGTISANLTWLITHDATVGGVVGGLWLAAVGGQKLIRTAQANRGVYFDEESNNLKKHE